MHERSDGVNYIKDMNISVAIGRIKKKTVEKCDGLNVKVCQEVNENSKRKKIARRGK